MAKRAPSTKAIIQLEHAMTNLFASDNPEAAKLVGALRSVILWGDTYIPQLEGAYESFLAKQKENDNVTL